MNFTGKKSISYYIYATTHSSRSKDKDVYFMNLLNYCASTAEFADLSNDSVSTDESDSGLVSD